MADPTMNAGPNRSDRRFLGIDVGGTNIKAGVVDDNGIVISTSSVPTESEKGPDHGVQQMHKVAMKAIRDADLSPADIHAVGLATPGTMDIPAGMLLDPPNLPGWKDFPVRQRVADAMQLPVVLQNDANAAAYGEYWAGSAKEANSLIFFTLGTGLGSGIIIDDFIIEGEHSHGAECGHTIIEMDDGRLCPTGQYGTGEAYCSATALLKMFEEAIESGRTSSVQQRINESTAISPLIIAEEAEHGD
ncbi:MAG: ROK family protein, partial [Planctomycetaceae bacterium]